MRNGIHYGGLLSSVLLTIEVYIPRHGFIVWHTLIWNTQLFLSIGLGLFFHLLVGLCVPKRLSKQTSIELFCFGMSFLVWFFFFFLETFGVVGSVHLFMIHFHVGNISFIYIISKNWSIVFMVATLLLELYQRFEPFNPLDSLWSISIFKSVSK